MGESRCRWILMGLIVAASIAITSCKESEDEEEEEEEEASMPAWCSVGSSHYNRGAQVCLNGTMQECQANGQWAKTEKECK